MAEGINNRIQQVRDRLLVVERERNELLRQLGDLERQAYLDAPPTMGDPLGQPPVMSVPVTADDRVSLFLTLFRCRESVYPQLWENKKKGTKGYAPVCYNDWASGLCNKPRVKCSECSHQSFRPLDEAAAKDHLLGKTTIGTYAIREDDTCVFLACDFDENDWSDDVAVYRRAGLELGIDVAVERSRSGNGAHAWIFFAEPVSARLARLLGTMLLARTTEQRHVLSVRSFDRFFPSQDYLPTTRHGFGNLIALPLQKGPREAGNSVFVDADMNPYPNQWTYLAGVRRLSSQELRSLVAATLVAPKNADERVDLALETDRALIERDEKVTNLPAPLEITVIRDEQVHIPLPGLPTGLITRLRRLATFPNPKFYEMQRMRLPTYPLQRFIFAGELRETELILPRGLIERASALLEKAGACLTIEDRRMARKGLKVEFTGVLTDEQAAAAAAMRMHDIGVVVSAVLYA